MTILVNCDKIYVYSYNNQDEDIGGGIETQIRMEQKEYRTQKQTQTNNKRYWIKEEKLLN